VLQFGELGYHLYVLFYVDKLKNVDRRLLSTYVHKKTEMLVGQDCHATIDEKNIKLISERLHDAYAVNEIMMKAYLDDGVDFFMLLFPRGPSKSTYRPQHIPSKSAIHYCFITVL